MAVTASRNGFYSSVTGQYYPDANSAHSAEAGAAGVLSSDGTPSPGAPDGSTSSGGSALSADDKLDAVNEANSNDEVANFAPDGTVTYRPKTSAELLADSQAPANAVAAPTNPNASAIDTVNQTIADLTPYTPQPLSTARSSAPTAAPLPVSTARVIGGKPQANAGTVDVTAVNRAALAAGTVQNPAVAPTDAGAPKVDTTATDNTVAGVNNTIAQLLDLANQSPQTSAAEAQLVKADQLARIRDQQSLADNQAAALGAARSGNRRDQALLQRQAIGESTYLGQADQRNQVVQQAELEGNLATLRSNEEQTDFTNRASILGKAADLGLNVAALQTDISKANLGAATDYLNNQFSQLGLDKQLSQQQTQNALSYAQAMAAIQVQYDSMSDADQKHTQDLMMSQYGIDAQTADVLAQIKANKKSTGEKVLDGVLGLVESTVPAAAVLLSAPAGSRINPVTKAAS